MATPHPEEILGQDDDHQTHSTEAASSGASQRVPVHRQRLGYPNSAMTRQPLNNRIDVCAHINIDRAWDDLAPKNLHGHTVSLAKRCITASASYARCRIFTPSRCPTHGLRCILRRSEADARRSGDQQVCYSLQLTMWNHLGIPST